LGKDYAVERLRKYEEKASRFSGMARAKLSLSFERRRLS